MKKFVIATPQNRTYLYLTHRCMSAPLVGAMTMDDKEYSSFDAISFAHRFATRGGARLEIKRRGLSNKFEIIGIDV